MLFVVIYEYWDLADEFAERSESGDGHIIDGNASRQLRRLTHPLTVGHLDCNDTSPLHTSLDQLPCRPSSQYAYAESTTCESCYVDLLG